MSEFRRAARPLCPALTAWWNTRSRFICDTHSSQGNVGHDKFLCLDRGCCWRCYFCFNSISPCHKIFKVETKYYKDGECVSRWRITLLNYCELTYTCEMHSLESSWRQRSERWDKRKMSPLGYSSSMSATTAIKMPKQWLRRNQREACECQ